MLVRKTKSERFPIEDSTGYNKAFYLPNLPARACIWNDSRLDHTRYSDFQAASTSLHMATFYWGRAVRHC